MADILKAVEKRATGKVTSALSVTSSQHESQGGALTETNMSAHDTRMSEIMSEGGEE